MHIKTTSGSGGSALGIIGTGLALALPDAKWIGWTLVAIGFLVFVFDVHIERGQIAAIGSTTTLKQRFRRMWPQYLMLVCGIGFFIGLVAFLQMNVEPSKAEAAKENGAKADSFKPVTLLTMFATDFKMKFTGVSTGWSKDLEIGDGYKTTINYDLHYDVGANAKFISVYIKESSHLRDIAKYVSDSAKSLFDDDQATLPWGMKSSGQSEIDLSKDIPFSGRVYIYCPGIFGLEDLAAITKLFRENGQALQVRGDEYAREVNRNIKDGHVKRPQDYEIKDNAVVPIKTN